MGSYIIKRILQMLAVIILVSVFIFLLMSFLPGDPVYALRGDLISPEEYHQTYLQLGLDKPIIVRYFTWLFAAFHGDFGTSVQFHEPISQLLSERIPVTIYLALISFVISALTGVIFGVITAVFRGKKIDTVITLLANITVCMPQFWIGILVMYIFSLKLGWLPSFGFTWPWVNLGKSIQQSIMPIFCLALGGIASTTRQTRSSMLEVIQQDYVRTARSKGMKEKRVILIHVLRNGLLPVITLTGLRLSFVLGGSMFIESVFSIPGMGSLLVKSIMARDIPVVQACVLITAALTCVINLLTDILYAAVDPRIRFERGEA